MSSHHFVKEGQEPALIIAHAEDAELLGALLEWAPFVIVLENATDTIHRLGIKADLIFANHDSVDRLKSDFAYQMPVAIIPSETNTLLQNAFQFLINTNQKFAHVSVLRAEDHMTQASNFVHQLEITLYSESTKWSSIVSGRFEKWMPSGSTLVVKAAGAFFVDGHVKITENRVEILADCLIKVRSDAHFWVGERFH